MSRLRLAAAALCAFYAAAPTVEGQALATNSIKTPSGNLELEYSYTLGSSRNATYPEGWWPTKLKNVAAGTDFAFERADPWTVEAWHKGSSTVFGREIRPAGANTSSYTFSAVKNSAGTKVIVKWLSVNSSVTAGGVSFNSNGDLLDVTATIEGKSNEQFYFTVEVIIRDGAGGAIESSIYTATYPRLLHEKSVGIGTSSRHALAIPVCQGQIIQNPAFSNGPFVLDALTGSGEPTAGAAFACPGGYSMQWSAFWDDFDLARGTVVHGTRDPDYHMKFFKFGSLSTSGNVNPYFRSLLAGLVQVPEDHLTTAAYASPYPYVLTLITGGWFDAAKQYRTWALQQNWIPKSSSGTPLPMNLNPDYSDYVKNAVAFAEDSADGCANGPAVTDQTYFANWNAYHQDRMSFLGITGKPVFGRVDQWDYNGYGTAEGWWLDATGAPSVPAAFTSGLAAVTAADPNFSTGPYFNFTAYDHPYDYGTTNDRSGTGYWPHAYVPNYTAPALPVDQYFAFDVDGGVNKLYAIGPRETSSDRFLGCGAPPFLFDTEQFALDVSHPFARDSTIFHAEKIVGATAGSQARGIYCDVASVISVGHGAISAGNLAGVPARPAGGGSWLTTSLRDIFASTRSAIRNATGNALPEFFTSSEGNNEALLDVLEYTHGRWEQRDEDRMVDWSAPGFSTSLRSVKSHVAPLFPAVYHEFHRTTLYLQPIYRDDSLFLMNDYDLFWSGRIRFAHSAWLGHPPSIGAGLNTIPPLPDNRLTGLRALAVPSGSNEFVPFTDYLAESCKLQARNDVHDLIVYGERMPDVATNAPLVSVTAHPLLGDFVSGSFPTVFASTFRRLGMGPGGVTWLAVPLHNWTKSTDTATKGHSSGSQTVTFSVNAGTYGMTLGYPYRLHVLLPNGGTSTSTGTYTFMNSATTHAFTVTVPQLSAVVASLQ